MKRTILLAASLLCSCSQSRLSTDPASPPPRITVQDHGAVGNNKIAVLKDSATGSEFLVIYGSTSQGGVAIQPLIKKP